MSDEPKKTSSDAPTFAGQVVAKATRKLKARRNSTQGVWFGLGMMGLIGWSVAIPTLLGAALGLWLDRRFPGGRSWTLALLVAGLTIGCLNAWFTSRPPRARASRSPSQCPPLETTTNQPKDTLWITW